jgi:hypothetical protein
MWLKLAYDNSESEFFKPDSIIVSVNRGQVIPINPDDKLVRTSKIFPLLPDNTQIPTFENAELHFFDYEKPFKVLGIINRMASEELKQKIYFSNGACSTIFISDNPILREEFFSLKLHELNGTEIWTIKNNKIHNFKFKLNNEEKLYDLHINDYSEQPLVIRSILDESVASLLVLKNKGANYDYSYLIEFLIKVINSYIDELKYFGNPKLGVLGSVLTDKKDVEDALLNQHLQNQIIDRIIQINSSLSYVSTQTYSGSIPILERRSIIRRSCLLGIGTSMRALTRIIRYIENAFLSVDFHKLITTSAHIGSPLNGLQKRMVNYNISDWYENNIDEIDKKAKIGIDDEYTPKMVYFSSRNAFRESEFAITASTNCITSGLSLHWTLMTITHEMLHSHVRTLLMAVFCKANDRDTFNSIYGKFREKYVNGNSNNYHLIDSIREVFLRYCIGTVAHGSISQLKRYDPKRVSDYNISIEDLEDLLAKEYKNIHEILVHTLDLHYFYRDDIKNYILIIWNSWSPLPEVNGDIINYVLRSLLAIASTINQAPYQRFNMAIDKFKVIITDNKDKLKNNHLTSKIEEILNTSGELKHSLWGAFKNSIILVDLAMNIFYSSKVSTQLWSDENVIIDEEENYSYNLPLDFIEDEVICPIPYLYDRMIKVMDGIIDEDDIERQTAISFLAMN